jgi:L-ascorbate metabolism protein UlaG (beta-lactamase superfamily)
MEQVAFFLMYFGQACFAIHVGDTNILIDPVPAKMGYTTSTIPADIVTISHEHFDHNAVEMAGGKPKILRGLTADGKGWAPVAFSNKDVKITAFPAYHDDTKGTQRGLDAMFLFEMGGLRVLHTGDLGHRLSAADVQKIGRVDVLLCVGGFYTIDADGATEVIKELKPRVVIPMHFRTSHTSSVPISEAGDFLKEWKDMRQSKDARVSFSRDLAGYPAGQTTVLFLPPAVDATAAAALAKP